MSTVSVAPAQEAVQTQIHILRRLLSFPAMICSLLGTLAVLTVRSRFEDPDLWWHLKSGQITWTTHHILATDIFSYTTHHHSYIPHEWLSQLLIFFSYRLAGYSGMMLWLCLSTAAVLIAGYGLCALYSGNAKVAFLGGLCIWIFGTIGFAIRPQMVGYLLLIAELVLLELGRRRSPRWFFGLPPLFAVWVNCHGSFFLGLIVAAVVLFSSCFEFRLGLLEAVRWDLPRRKTLGFAIALSALALLLNPAGLQLVLYPINTMTHQSIAINAVAEWLPAPASDPRTIAMFGVLAIIFVTVLVRQSSLMLQELLLIGVAAWLAESHQRLLFPFGILVAPILCRFLAASWDNYHAERDLPLANALLITASLAVAFFGFPDRANIAAQINAFSPVKPLAFLKTHHPPGPLLNQWVDGGYLIWAAPEYPVFIDGRSDVFEWTGVLEEYAAWATLAADPNTLLDKHQVNICLLERQNPMSRVLALLPNWKPLYSDERYILFQREKPLTPPSQP